MVLLTEKELKNLTYIQLIEYITKLHKIINIMNDNNTENNFTKTTVLHDSDECIICGQCLCDNCFDNIINSKHCPVCN